MRPQRPALDAPPIDLGDLSLDAFAGRPAAVLGFARSGIALARFLADRGARVTVYDARPAADLGDAVEALAGRPVRLLLGPAVDPADALAGQSLVATSPAISSHYPTTEPRLRAALGQLAAAGCVPIVSEVDLFLRLCPAPTVGVTGTKGKTTTSALIAAILEAGSHRVFLGGNIGTPLVERLPDLTPGDRVVLELSELQLPTLSRGTTVAVYTHVTQDHLDRHGSVAAYRAAKRRLVELVDPRGALVVNAEDPVSAAWSELPEGPTHVVRYRRSAPEPGGLGIADGWIVGRDVDRLPAAGRATERGEVRVGPVAEVRLPGVHNLSNVLAAVAVGLLFGLEPTAIRGAVAGFEGVEHRLETVALTGRVRFVNDSQGTQPDAVIAALESFAPPIVLIAGGQDKGVPLDALARVAVERAAAVMLIGESAPLLAAALAAAGHRHVERAASLDEAVTRGRDLAEGLLEAAPDDATATLLLSPAAASFDMFQDYAARGRAFRAAVAALAEERRPG